MRLLGLVVRSCGTPEEFLAFVDRRATRTLLAGVGLILLGVALIAATGASTGVEIWFAAICIAGAAFAWAGAQARSWTARARPLLAQQPLSRDLTTTAVAGGLGLRALLASDAAGPSVAFAVAWDSFGVRAVEGAPARVYGSGAPRSLVLVECDAGYAMGTIARAPTRRQAQAPPDPFVH